MSAVRGKVRFHPHVRSAALRVFFHRDCDAFYIYDVWERPNVHFCIRNPKRAPMSIPVVHDGLVNGQDCTRLHLCYNMPVSLFTRRLVRLEEER
jgi:hypothetical protein